MYTQAQKSHMQNTPMKERPHASLKKQSKIRRVIGYLRPVSVWGTAILAGAACILADEERSHYEYANKNVCP